MNTPKNRSWLTWKKVACVVLLLLAALYIYAEPTLERWLGWDLPSINVGQEGQPGADDIAQADQPSQEASQPVDDESQRTSSPPGYKLEDVGNGLLRSPAGLVYGNGPGGESRIDHILRHAKDDPSRPIHGVFDGDRDKILKLLDEAYKLILAKSNRVTAEKSGTGPGDRIAYVVDMKRRVGYVGGKSGADRNFPETRRIKLVLEGSRPVTAYPF